MTAHVGTPTSMWAGEYQTKPVPVEAIRFTSMVTGNRVVEWSQGAVGWAGEFGDAGLLLHRGDGTDEVVHQPWWFVRWPDGDITACSGEAFDEEFEGMP